MPARRPTGATLARGDEQGEDQAQQGDTERHHRGLVGTTGSRRRTTAAPPDPTCEGQQGGEPGRRSRARRLRTAISAIADGRSRGRGGASCARCLEHDRRGVGHGRSSATRRHGQATTAGGEPIRRASNCAGRAGVARRARLQARCRQGARGGRPRAPGGVTAITPASTRGCTWAATTASMPSSPPSMTSSAPESTPSSRGWRIATSGAAGRARPRRAPRRRDRPGVRRARRRASRRWSTPRPRLSPRRSAARRARRGPRSPSPLRRRAAATGRCPATRAPSPSPIQSDDGLSRRRLVTAEQGRTVELVAERDHVGHQVWTAARSGP